jgi:hypothetical protein
MRSDFELEMASLVNRYSVENASDTPDYILARYIAQCLDAYGEAVRARDCHMGNPMGRQRNTGEVEP